MNIEKEIEDDMTLEGGLSSISDHLSHLEKIEQKRTRLDSLKLKDDQKFEVTVSEVKNNDTPEVITNEEKSETHTETTRERERDQG